MGAQGEGRKEIFQVMEVFNGLAGGSVTWVYAFVKIHQMGHLSYAYFILCKFYILKAI